MIEQKHILGGFRQITRVPAHAAATATESYPIFSAPFACSITAIKINPITAVTGADTNTTHLNIDDASGEIADLDLTSGNDLTANVDNTITISTATTLTKGQNLELEFEKIGSGLAVPASLMVIEYDAN